MRRPLLGSAIIFALGIAVGTRVSPDPLVPTMLFVLCVTAWLRFRRRGAPRRVLAAALAALVMTGWSASAYDRARAAAHTGRYRALAPERIRARGRMGGESRWVVNDRGSLRVSASLRDVELLGANGEVLRRLPRLTVRWFGPDTTQDPDFGLGLVPLPGERWVFAGRLQARPSGAEAVAPDWRLVTSVRDARRLQAARNNSLQRIVLWRERMFRRLMRGIESHAQVRIVLRAMLLGDRDGMPYALQQAFIESGTLHVFAVSGLHVGMLSLVGVALLRFCGTSRRYWILLLGPLIVAYVLAVGMRPSALRAAVMVLLYLAGPSVGRRADAFSAWSGAALVLLALQPGALFSPGFMLSFGVVAGLLVWTPGLLCLARRLAQQRLAALDRRALALDAETEVSPPHLEQWQRRGLQLAAVSLAAWLSSAPLTAYYFGRLNWVGIPANLAMTPLAFLTLVGAVLSLLGGTLAASLALVCNHAVLALSYAMVAVAQFFAGLPFASIEIVPPSAWMTLAAYLLLLRIGLALPRQT